jgi:hypothetical protein
LHYFGIDFRQNRDGIYRWQLRQTILYGLDFVVAMATESDQEEIEGLIPIPVTKKLKKSRQSKAAKARENSNSKKKLSKGVEAALVDELHAGQHESVNGNFNHDGAFKEWHEVVTKETVNGDLLYILPYSVID